MKANDALRRIEELASDRLRRSAIIVHAPTNPDVENLVATLNAILAIAQEALST